MSAATAQPRKTSGRKGRGSVDGTSALVLEPVEGIPQYLERPRPGVQTFGTLKYVRRKGERYWEIHGDPQAVLMAKRVFPGSEGRGPGVAKFPATNRAFPDLVWFLMRWPMEIENQGQWEKDYHDACRQVVRRAELNLNPVQALPAPEFTGTLRPFQGEGLSWSMTNRRTLIADEMGLGKAQPLSATLVTPTGLKTMGDVAIGMEVIGPDGKPTLIEGVFPQGRKSIYRVTFSDGSSTECCGEHLWPVQSTNHRFRGTGFTVKQTQDLIGDLTYDSNGNAKWYIPICKPVEFQAQVVPVDPYLLGVLLGDGYIPKSKYGSILFSSCDNEIIERVTQALPSGVTLKKKGGENCDYRFSVGKRGAWQNRPHLLQAGIRELGLWGHGSFDKFIPNCYLYNSLESRVALLQGLMDTDGYVSKDGAIDFTVMSRPLAEGVMFLVQSLGGVVRWRERKVAYHGKTAFRLRISLPNEIRPFHLSRKAERVVTRTKYVPSRAIKNITYLREEEAQCIRVAAEHHCYLTDHCIVTHNTPTALAFLATVKEWPALVVAPPHLVRHWEKKTAEFLTVVTGTEVGPEMPLFQSRDDAGSTEGLIVHTIKGLKPYPLPKAHIYICHYLILRAWREALKDLEMPTVIFDEVQELRHSGTEKYSAASDLSNLAVNAIGLSGTPVYNRGAEIWNVINALDYHALGDYDSFTKEWCTGYGKDTVADPALLGHHLRREGLMIRRRKEDVLDDLPAKRRLVQSIEGDSALFRDLVKTAVKLAKDSKGLTDVFERGRMERDALNEARQATGIAKAPAVAAFVRGLMEAEEPTLVFAYHHSVFDKLGELLKEFKPVFITGRENKAQKDASMEAFQRGDTNLCIISLRAATGLDGLQERARVVVFGELDWSPAVHSQAEDRAHRMGQRDSVLCYYLVSELGMDPDMQEALGLKVSQFVGLMGDKPETEDDRALANSESESHMKKVLEKLRAMPGAA